MVARSGKNLAKARKAKMDKRHRRMAGAGKRTIVGKSIGKEAFQIGTPRTITNLTPRGKALAKARRVKKRKAHARKAGAAKRTKVGKSLTKQLGKDVFEIGTTKMTVEKTIPINQEIKGGWVSDKVLSPHHKANLIKPDKPFSNRTMLIRRLQGGYMSTAIESFEYIPERKVLRITFWKIKIRNNRIVSRSKGGIYIFFPVSNRVYLELLNASSKGRYFYYQIRPQYKKSGRYRYKKIG